VIISFLSVRAGQKSRKIFRRYAESVIRRRVREKRRGGGDMKTKEAKSKKYYIALDTHLGLWLEEPQNDRLRQDAVRHIRRLKSFIPILELI